MTKIEALILLMKDYGGIVTWEIIYNEIEKYYPAIKSPKDWQAALRGVLYRDLGKKIKRIDEGVFSLIDYDENNLLPQNNKIKETSKDVMVQIRIAQSLFRNSLIKNLKMCPLTQINDHRLLVASHIKPWCVSNNQERVDINNGLIFSPTIDKLFDRGLISFTQNKELMVSPSISSDNIKKLNLYEGKKYDLLKIENRENYLQFHREKIFISA